LFNSDAGENGISESRTLMITENIKPAAPNAVRVWRGYKDPKLPLDQFYSKLGTVFVPSTVLMQINAGLYSYTPTVPAGLAGKPDMVPDETAILFWDSQETYWNGFSTLAVRTYTLTHGGVYLMPTPGSQDTADNQSRADLPDAFSGTLEVAKPVYLFEKAADWMHGAVTHLVAGRATSVDATAFRIAIAKALSTIQKQVPLEGAIACVGNDYLVYWELKSRAPGTPNPPSGVPALQAVISGWSQVFTPAATFLPIGLWDEWLGMDVRAGSSFNLQFTRRPAVEG
jgi:hypothetical protein